MSKRNSIGKFRLILTDYFDAITNEIDLFAETELQRNFEDDTKLAEINKSREVLLCRVKEIEHLNLRHLNETFDERNLNAYLGDFSQLFTVFCFVLPFDNDIRLIVTDGYLSVAELEIYKSLIKFKYFYQGTWHALIDEKRIISKLVDENVNKNFVKN
jgi:hypothetical protein